MGIINQKWQCELGGEIYADRDGVRNAIYIEDGEHNRNYIYVCDKHTKEVAEVLDEKFQKNKYIKVVIN